MQGSKDHEGDKYNNSPRPKSHNFKICFCKYCGRRFLNSQALGGHQNAHKREKRDAKHRKQEMTMMASFELPMLMPYSPYTFVQPHGLAQQQIIIRGQPMFPGTCYYGQQPLSYGYWPGSYRLNEGALYSCVAAGEITINNQVKADGGAKEQGEDEIRSSGDDRRRLSELPDLNLDLSL